METSQNHQGELERAMLPFVMRELVDMVMKKKALPMEDALYHIYSSRLYQSLSDERVKLWYLSTPLLYETLEKEKAKGRQAQSNDANILLFKMFCIENFKESQNLSAEEALLLFSRYRVFDFLTENFEMLHTQDIDYIVDTIKTYINKKK